jgi:hypothetical protein
MPVANAEELEEWRLWVEDLPCLQCLHPCGDDVRFALAQDQLDLQQRTPSGLPMLCCRVRVIGAVAR